MPPAIPLFLEPATRGVADHACVPRETNSPFLGVGCIPAISDWFKHTNHVFPLTPCPEPQFFGPSASFPAISNMTAWQNFLWKSFHWKLPKKQGTQGGGASGVLLFSLWCCSESRNMQSEGWKQGRHSLRTPPCSLLSAAGSAHPFTPWHIVNLTHLLQRTFTLSATHKMGQKSQETQNKHSENTGQIGTPSACSLDSQLRGDWDPSPALATGSYQRMDSAARQLPPAKSEAITKASFKKDTWESRVQPCCLWEKIPRSFKVYPLRASELYFKNHVSVCMVLGAYNPVLISWGKQILTPMPC